MTFTFQMPRTQPFQPAHQRLARVSDQALMASLQPTPPKNLWGTALTDWRRAHDQHLPQMNTWAKQYEPDMRAHAPAQMLDMHPDKARALFILDALSSLPTGAAKLGAVPAFAAATALTQPTVKTWFARLVEKMPSFSLQRAESKSAFTRWLAHTPDGQHYQAGLNAFARQIDAAVEKLDIQAIIKDPKAFEGMTKTLAQSYDQLMWQARINPGPSAAQHSHDSVAALDQLSRKFIDSVEAALLNRGYMPTSMRAAHQTRTALNHMHAVFKLSDADMAQHARFKGLLAANDPQAMSRLSAREQAELAVWQADPGQFFYARHAQASPELKARVQSAIDLEAFKVGLNPDNYRTRLQAFKQTLREKKSALHEATAAYRQAQTPLTITHQAMTQATQRLNALADAQHTLARLGHTPPPSLTQEMGALERKLAELNQAYAQRANHPQFIQLENHYRAMKAEAAQLKLMEQQL
ncbi:MAG TPA: hypothetical protein PLQ67_09420, partial [Burkholderiaceae bacterium]|nr:hypothetical protein [Burkholderiaceae bacterium]